MSLCCATLSVRNIELLDELINTHDLGAMKSERFVFPIFSSQMNVFYRGANFLFKSIDSDCFEDAIFKNFPSLLTTIQRNLDSKEYFTSSLILMETFIIKMGIFFHRFKYTFPLTL